MSNDTPLAPTHIDMLNPPDIPVDRAVRADRDGFLDSAAVDIRLIAAAARRFRLRHELDNDEPDDGDNFDPPAAAPASHDQPFISTREPVTSNSSPSARDTHRKERP